MTATRTGIMIGAVLALTWIVFGSWASLFVAVAMAIGALIGRIVEGKLDVSSLVSAVQGKKSSS
ncbi:DUF2273 domain-containing protein [Cryobacterium sp. PH31-L1]|uniref:DUF2273 domain-containing protein n=1 Tax=Cryobacterium sp. PH31-L1 TaxID=3046199 RepID=UPI0024BA43CF|nr:DUF2273 domain-containing protein [Cryobacterium sp. PH31-L1]MDJ0379055.1 DUF2273 domain-containing protein [Cryobacterium sp. PH31-L1]